MKRHPKPFSVEIKKSRDPGPRSQLPPRRLFDAPLVETTKTFRKEKSQSATEPSAAPRILPSIVESVWSSPAPVEPVQRKRFSGRGSPEQIEFNLAATAAEDVMGAHAGAPASANSLPQIVNTPVDAEDALPVHDVQPAQDDGMRAKSRKPRRKSSGTAEQEIASEPLPEVETPAPSVESKVAQRRITKRLAAAAQLPRHERWKGRLHPAAW
jgi:hypothetical protein